MILDWWDGNIMGPLGVRLSLLSGTVLVLALVAWVTSRKLAHSDGPSDCRPTKDAPCAGDLTFDGAADPRRHDHSRAALTVDRGKLDRLTEDFRVGPDEAALVVHIFFDFSCPGCAALVPTCQRLLRVDDLPMLLVFKNLPMDSQCNRFVKDGRHAGACELAILGRCAGAFGKFWEFFQGTYAAGDASEASLKALGLTDDQLAQCRNLRPQMERKVREDIEGAVAMQVASTPAIFVNGNRLLDATDYPTMLAFLRKAADNSEP